MKVKPHISQEHLQKGRGSQSNPHNRFFAQRYESSEDGKMAWQLEDEDEAPKTTFIDIFPKSILSKNNSPDLGFSYSMNPYNGCEHGCVYCYARNSHEYWGYSAGVDFEQKILVKKDAPKLLDEALSGRNWKPELIVLSGNTDCYQPAERSFGLTRTCLEVFLKHKHPIGIITKNALILRDLDLLQQLHADRLVGVTISITSLREEIRRTLEPRTSSIPQKLKAVEQLVKAGIPVNINMAPIIPGINSDEVFELVKTVGDLGVQSVSYIMVRLNGQIANIFEDWVTKSFPERAEKIIAQIKETHGGTLQDSRFGNRMKGEGHFAQQIKDMFAIARKRYITAGPFPELNYDAYIRNPSDQLSLF